MNFPINKRLYPLFYFLAFYLFTGILIVLRFIFYKENIMFFLELTSNSYDEFKQKIIIGYISFGIFISILILLFEFILTKVKGIIKVTIFYISIIAFGFVTQGIREGQTELDLTKSMYFNLILYWVVTLIIVKLIKICYNFIKSNYSNYSTEVKESEKHLK